MLLDVLCALPHSEGGARRPHPRAPAHAGHVPTPSMATPPHPPTLERLRCSASSSSAALFSQSASCCWARARTSHTGGSLLQLVEALRGIEPPPITLERPHEDLSVPPPAPPLHEHVACAHLLALRSLPSPHSPSPRPGHHPAPSRGRCDPSTAQCRSRVLPRRSRGRVVALRASFAPTRRRCRALSVNGTAHALCGLTSRRAARTGALPTARDGTPFCRRTARRGQLFAQWGCAACSPARGSAPLGVPPPRPRPQLPL